MAKVASLLFVLAALIAAGVFLFSEDNPEVASLDIGEEFEDEEHAPELRTSDGARPGAGRRTPKAPVRKGPKAAPRGKTLFLKGVVLDAATGKPVTGARIQAEYADSRCPRLPHALEQATAEFEGPRNNGTIRPRGLPARLAGVLSGDDGRFHWMVGDVRILAPSFDVFASAPGYITHVLCAPSAGDDVTIRLERALQLAVTVTDRHGHPIEGASLVAKPGPETQQIPGHAGVATTDKNGRASIDGLAPGEIVLTVDHPAWMPTTTEPFDPSIDKAQTVELVPALRLRFTIRSDDAQGIRLPSLAWRTDGEPPHHGLLLLRVTPNGTHDAKDAEVKSEPVRIPCEHRTVNLELKAEGFAAWRQPEPLPAAGGEREIIVLLTRDTALGSLEIVFQGPDGKPIEYRKLGAGMPSITPLEEIDIGAVTLEAGTSLWLKSLPAGRYEIGKRSPEYAPGTVVADVRPGGPTKVTMKLRPAAKLHVVFRAYDRTTVQFRLRRGRELLMPFSGGKAKGGAEASGPSPLTALGDEGALFTGLPAGACTIEVTSPELVATHRTVQLQEGETTEVEIEVRKR